MKNQHIESATTVKAYSSHTERSQESYIHLPATERIKLLRAEKWFNYEIAKNLIEEMETMLELPDSIRNPGLLITAPPNNGKSWLVHHFARKYPAKENDEGTGVSVPVVLINCPHKPDINWFLSNILTAVNAPHRASDKSHSLFDQVVGMCRRLNVRLIIADEISDIVDGTAMQQRHFLNMLKSLNNELERPIILTGTSRIISAMSIDEQVKRRFSQRELPEWKADAEFIGLLAAFENKIPLLKPSDLAASSNRYTAIKILEKSKGRIGYITELIYKAAEKAIINGAEQITGEIIDSIKMQN